MEALYSKKRTIGEGTFGAVYEAQELTSNKRVAIKSICAKMGEHVIPKEKFDREIETLKKLGKHPNITEMLSIIEEPTVTYIVMELAQHDLRGIMEQQISAMFSRSVVKTFAHQILAGVVYCHSKGIMHRDLKPENILYFQPEGRMKLADFGMARAHSVKDYGRLTSAVTTLYYRAPELLCGMRSYDFAIDLWSYGCLLGELLMNSPLMPGKTDEDQLQLIWALCGSSPLFPKSAGVRDIDGTLRVRNKSVHRKSHFTKLATQLIDGLLQLDPKKRITDAINHPYFKTEWPGLTAPENLPRFREPHFGARKKKKRKH